MVMVRKKEEEESKEVCVIGVAAACLEVFGKSETDGLGSAALLFCFRQERVTLLALRQDGIGISDLL